MNRKLTDDWKQEKGTDQKQSEENIRLLQLMKDVKLYIRRIDVSAL